ncbi:Hypothetical_protein [Hexamita inflata]|uniref:Hypothetical_protein n=1 Tax=Hexamita inflata TaxID=28002 RepID=A0AA86V407_9EUKA|nr:Hypothetical protein HINF_LOCUS63032 [Hexamita inflata]
MQQLTKDNISKLSRSSRDSQRKLIGSRKSHSSCISEAHTTLFDISENCSKITQEQQFYNIMIDKEVSDNSKLDSEYIFWDQSSVDDVKLLEISQNDDGKREIKEIVIETSGYKGEQHKEEDIFDLLF